MIEPDEIFRLTGLDLAQAVYNHCLSGDDVTAPFDDDELDRLLNDRAAVMNILERLNAEWGAESSEIGFPPLARINWDSIKVSGEDPVETRAANEQEGWLRAALLIQYELNIWVE